MADFKKFNRKRAVESAMLARRAVPGFKNDIDATADILRDTYVNERTTAYPNYRLNHNTHSQTFWRELAIIVRDGGMDPVSYVKAIMSKYGAGTSPNSLKTKDRTFIYKERVDDNHKLEMLELELKLYVRRVAVLKALNLYTLKQILTDPSNSFDPVFVYCMAMDSGLTDVAMAVKPQTEFRLNSKAYQKVYINAFPGVLNGNNK